MSYRDIEKNLEKFRRILKEEALKAVDETMVDIAKQSNSECPLQIGPLRESMLGSINGEVMIKGKKDGIEKNKGYKVEIDKKIEGIISYDTEYAIMQHENTSFNHPTPGTKAKFLEDPIRQHEAVLEKRVKKAVENAIKKGGI